MSRIYTIDTANLVERFTKRLYVASNVDEIIILLENKLTARNNQLNACKREYKDLEEKYLALEDVKNKALENLKAVQKVASKCAEEKASLETVNQNLIKDNTKLKTELEELKEKLAKLESEVETLEDQPVCDVNGKITFTDETLEEMLHLLQNGSTYTELSEKYGVSRSTISRRIKEKYPNIKELLA